MIRLGLDRVRKALARLGHPEEDFASVIIAGTNGKGSVSALIESAARAAGLRTGHYTSPHLTDIRERVRTNGEMIPTEDWRRLSRRVDASVSGRAALTEFERQTILAFLHFAEKKVDLAVVEVGLGGRLDAVNALPAPEATVIASIGHDHAEWLGSTLRKIYFEKRGVLRAGTPMIQSAPRALWPEGDRHYGEAGVPVWTLDRDVRVRTRRVDWQAGYQLVDVESPVGVWRAVQIPFLGSHQARNAALALAACHQLKRRGWPLREEFIREGFRLARWPGRFEVVSGRPTVILDGAHNVEAAQALAETLKASPWGRKPVSLVFGCLKDKDAVGMARVLKPRVRRVFLTPLPSKRSRPVAELKTLWGGRETIPCGSAEEALRAAVSLGDVTVATGSLYLVGEAIKIFRRKQT